MGSPPWERTAQSWILPLLSVARRATSPESGTTASGSVTVPMQVARAHAYWLKS